LASHQSRAKTAAPKRGEGGLALTNQMLMFKLT
jgi:hypothetical protein